MTHTTHSRAGARRLAIAVLVALALLGAACKRRDPQAEIAAAAQAAAADEQAAEAMATQFEDAFAQQNWDLARGHGDVLLMDHPDSAAAARLRPRIAEAKAKAEQAQQQRRLASLWAYGAEPVKGGTQLSAAIYSQVPIDVDGSGARPVRLIFRDHPDWGRSSYLVLERGDFRCPGGCRVRVRLDDGAPAPMAATRPDTDEAIAMFIEDERGLWRKLRGAKVLSVEFPVRAGGTRTAVFEVGGLDRAKLPGWD